jgi:hypothetical protein
MLRYKLRTLLIVLALGPPVLAGLWFARIWGLANIDVAVPMFLGLGVYLSIAMLAVVLYLRSSHYPR